MRRPSGPVILLLLVCLLGLGAAPPPPAVQGRWSPHGPVHLGDPVVLEVAVPLGSPEFFLEGDLVPGADWGPARVVSIQKTPPAAFPGALRVAVTLQVFTTGTVALPGARLAVHDRGGLHDLRLMPPPLRVEPLLPTGDAPRPPQVGPLPLPRGIPWAWVLLAVTALCAAALAVSAGVRRVRARAASPRTLPTLRETDPPLWARQEVERIFSARLDPGARYETLSVVLRTLLEWRFGRPFLEWTGPEVRDGLASLPDLSPEAGQSYEEILKLCDRVLFARHLPTAEEDGSARARALRALALTPPKAPAGKREAA